MPEHPWVVPEQVRDAVNVRGWQMQRIIESEKDSRGTLTVGLQDRGCPIKFSHRAQRSEKKELFS
jgi:hypothetical protein